MIDLELVLLSILLCRQGRSFTNCRTRSIGSIVLKTVADDARAENSPADPPPAYPAKVQRTYIRPRSGWQPIHFREIWRARDLLWVFATRDVIAQYKQTFFGFAWALVVPVVQVVVFSIFFGKFLGVGDRVDEAAGRPVPYPLFALSGQIVWSFFSSFVTNASNSLITNAAIIRKIYVPRLVLPLAAIGKPAMDTGIVFVLLLAVTGWYAASAEYDVWLSPLLLLSPLILAASAVPALAVGLIFAAVTVSYRDLRFVLPFAVQTLFYVTPVIYPVEILPERLEWLIYLNPIAGFVQAHRASVMALPIDWFGLGISVVVSLLLLIIGLFYFARVERHFADVA